MRNETEQDVGQAITEWLTRLYGGNPPLQSQAQKLHEEYKEAQLLLDYEEREFDELDPKTRTELARELADLATVCLGMIGVLGLDPLQELTDKLSITVQKYNPDLVRKLMLRGYDLNDALRLARYYHDHSPQQMKMDL